MASQLPDWSLCILCQQHDTGLVNPNKKGYKSMANILSRWQNEVGSVPISVSLERLTGESVLSTSLQVNNAKWHKACELKINQKNLSRALERKRKQTDKNNNSATAKKRSLGRTTSTQNIFPRCCFLCDETSEDGLRDVTTMNVDTNVKSCARKLQDFALLSKMGQSDLIALEARYHSRCLLSYYRKAKVHNRVKD